MVIFKLFNKQNSLIRGAQFKLLMYAKRKHWLLHK